MSEPMTRSVVVERDIPFPPERIWRALTQPHLIEAWLMTNDFEPIVGHAFVLRGDWGAVDCRVVEIVPYRVLSYTWAAMGLESVVTWTLTATHAGTRVGTHLRMEQAGFRSDQEQAFQGAKHGWRTFVSKLVEAAAQADEPSPSP